MSEEEEIYEEDLPEIVELVDDNGEVIKFKLLDIYEYKGEDYALLLAAEPDEEFAEDEVIIFRYLSEDGVLEPIEDDALLEEIFEAYQNEDIPEEN